MSTRSPLLKFSIMISSSPWLGYTQQRRQLIRDNRIHGNRERPEHPPVLLEMRFGWAHPALSVDGRDLGLIAMSDCVTKVDQCVQVGELLLCGWTDEFEHGNEADAQTSEVCSECGLPRIADVELAPFCEQYLHQGLLRGRGCVDVYPDGAVMQVAAVSLELSHKSDKQASVKLGCLPAPARSRARRL